MGFAFVFILLLILNTWIFGTGPGSFQHELEKGMLQLLIPASEASCGIGVWGLENGVVTQ